MSNISFNEFALSKDVMRAIVDMGFEEATPIQSLAIPYLLDGKDIIGQAQTGTGKTCAFGIPAIERLQRDLSKVQVLILCPTRELAIQICEELKCIAKYKRWIHILPIYGGQPIDRQIQSLRRKPQIIIGTPGRVMDHMRRRTIDFSGLTTIVLDEADEMLNMGFRDDIDLILKSVPLQRQTELFSATMSSEIMQITKLYQTDAVVVKASHKELTLPNIEQFYVEVKESGKLELLSRMIDAYNIKSALVFCNTKRKVDEVTYGLQNRGYDAEALHGDMKQSQRDKVMSGFRKNAFEILVASDVAARGIDIDDVEVVFNYDIPSDDEYYVHRIGRTGRAGRTGKSYSFIWGREMSKLLEIQKYSGTKIQPMKIPTLVDVEQKKVLSTLEDVSELISSHDISRFVLYIQTYLNQYLESSDSTNSISTMDIAAALLKQMVSPNDNSDDFLVIDDGNSLKVRLFVSVGRKENLTPKSLSELITANTSLDPKQLSYVNVLEGFSFIEVPKEYVTEITESMRNIRVEGRRIFVDRAKDKKVDMK